MRTGFVQTEKGKKMSNKVEVIRCKDCRWWEKKEYGAYGYCHATKHSYYSRHWEINIHRTYEENFYCADAELRTEEEEGEQ